MAQKKKKFLRILMNLEVEPEYWPDMYPFRFWKSAFMKGDLLGVKIPQDNVFYLLPSNGGHQVNFKNRIIPFCGFSIRIDPITKQPRMSMYLVKGKKKKNWEKIYEWPFTWEYFPQVAGVIYLVSWKTKNHPVLAKRRDVWHIGRRGKITKFIRKNRNKKDRSKNGNGRFQ